VSSRFIAILVTDAHEVAREVARVLETSAPWVELHVLSSFAPLDRYTQHVTARVLLLHTTKTHKDPLSMLAVYRQTLTRTGGAPLPVVLLAQTWTAHERVRALHGGAEDTVDFSELGFAALPHLVTRASTEVGEYTKRLSDLVRLQALGELASSVAHDFNNFLSAIIGRTGSLKRVIEEPHRRSVEIIERAALDATEMVRRIRRFAKGEAPAPHSHADLVELVRGALDIIGPTPQHAIALEGAKRAVISCNAIEIREVLVNLVQNAIDASPEGAAITIVVHASSDAVQLLIQDAGTGMSDDVLARATDPFFSTKGERGTGLGLSISSDIMHQHAGTLEIHSREGAGTVVALRFPTKLDPRAASR
jgi:signal transduction histidine kinase